MTNLNDTIRSQILQYFHERNSSATSRFGKRGSAAKISDVKRDLKAQHNLLQQQVVSNLTYLTDKKLDQYRRSRENGAGKGRNRAIYRHVV